MIWPALVIVFMDQISKWAIILFLRVHESVTVTGFFNLVHVRNRGMAFGLMNRPDFDAGFYLLTAATVVAVVLLLAWFFKLKKEDARIAFGLSLILGGAVGNLIDRLRFREVVDFLDVHLGPYHWPAFNVADSAITVGTFWVAIILIFYRSSNS
ncbi:MAG: signal peptidase II [Deltaproteobacteria bacterium]|nr:signal peptidase II [Deltaproteobacteria bacterium]MBW2616061.1 signal peptidase II [Deltaproteobacteria bacterium]